jgi:hypothetical protein
MAHDPSGDVDSDSADIAIRLLNRSHVETAPYFQAYLADGVAHGYSTENRRGRFIEES